MVGHLSDINPTVRHRYSRVDGTRLDRCIRAGTPLCSEVEKRAESRRL